MRSSRQAMLHYLPKRSSLRQRDSLVALLAQALEAENVRLLHVCRPVRNAGDRDW
jgi:hypothetical protein